MLRLEQIPVFIVRLFKLISELVLSKEIQYSPRIMHKLPSNGFRDQSRLSRTKKGMHHHSKNEKRPQQPCSYYGKFLFEAHKPGTDSGSFPSVDANQQLYLSTSTVQHQTNRIPEHHPSAGWIPEGNTHVTAKI